MRRNRNSVKSSRIDLEELKRAAQRLLAAIFGILFGIAERHRSLSSRRSDCSWAQEYWAELTLSNSVGYSLGRRSVLARVHSESFLGKLLQGKHCAIWLGDSSPAQ